VTAQRGGFVLGMVVGLLLGLSLALGVALYITKAPVPFLNKVPQRTAEQDSAETERNRRWDPNAPLAGKRPVSAASDAASSATAAASGVAVPAASVAGTAPSARDPAAILAGAAPPGPPASASAGRNMADAYVYFVQAGAFTRGEDAEQQRARLALMGQSARVSEREQAGRTVYRVRLGPFPTREEADALQVRLQEQTVETQIVRTDKP
jgi:cell division protein FtsN